MRNKLIIILLCLLLILSGCGSKEVEMPSDISKIIDDGNYYNKELYIDYDSDFDL